jgi:hypothetical protein
LGYTVSDIQINGQAIQWAGQVAQTFQIQLSATGFPGTSLPKQAVQGCQKSSTTPTPQPLALIDIGLLNAYNLLYLIDGNVTNSPVLPPPVLQQGQSVELALQCSDVAVNPSISFGSGITVAVNSVDHAKAAISGDRKADSLATRTFRLTISVDAGATTGQRALTVTNPGQGTAIAAPAFLTVVPAGWTCA